MAKAGLNGGMVVFSSGLNSGFYSNSVKVNIYILKEVTLSKSFNLLSENGSSIKEKKGSKYFLFRVDPFSEEDLCTQEQTESHNKSCLSCKICRKNYFIYQDFPSWNYIWAAPCENVSSVICGQRRPRPACAEAQADVGLRCPLTELLDTT